VRAALYGATAAAAGLAIGTAVKMTVKIPFDPVVALVAVAAFAGSVLRLPLPLILAVLVPTSFAFARARR
jgi:chromate transporter